MPRANLPHSGRASSKDQPSQYASMGDKAAASSIIAIRKYLIKITSELGRHCDVISQEMNYRASGRMTWTAERYAETASASATRFSGTPLHHPGATDWKRCSRIGE